MWTRKRNVSNTPQIHRGVVFFCFVTQTSQPLPQIGCIVFGKSECCWFSGHQMNSNVMWWANWWENSHNEVSASSEYEIDRIPQKNALNSTYFLQPNALARSSVLIKLFRNSFSKPGIAAQPNAASGFEPITIIRFVSLEVIFHVVVGVWDNN